MSKIEPILHRHAEFISASISWIIASFRDDKWTLNQVQGDELFFEYVKGKTA